MAVLTIATANFCTLGQTASKRGRFAGKQKAIHQQCHQAGIHVLGAQECRMKEGLTQSQHYIMATGPHEKGALGVAIWVSCMLPFAERDGKPLRVKRTNLFT
eukprot:4013513-Lingulodinium_polyedra.AAC.1